MTEPIKLPPEFLSANDVPAERATIKRERMIEIIAAAIEADRKRRGEPVALTTMQRQMIRNVVHEVGQRSRCKGDYHDQIADLLTSIASAPQPTEPVSQHPDDEAVDAFAATMKAKLAKKRTEGRGNWQMCTSTYLSRLLREHVEKGDPVDVANLAMMLHQNGQCITLTEQVARSSVREFEEWLNDNRRHDVSSVFHEIVARYAKAAQPIQQTSEPVAWWKVFEGQVSVVPASTFIAEDAIALGWRSLVFSDAAPQPQRIPEPSPLRESMSSNHRSYAEGWNACRGAMIESTKSTTNKAPPPPTPPVGLKPREVTYSLFKSKHPAEPTDEIINNQCSDNKERYAVACLLSSSDFHKYTFSGTLHVIFASSEEEAKGIAVIGANKNKPGLGVHDVLCIKIDDMQLSNIPEGHKLVPIEPTEEMINAAIQDGISVNGKPIWKHNVAFQAKWRYQQMLKVAEKK